MRDHSLAGNPDADWEFAGAIMQEHQKFAPQ